MMAAQKTMFVPPPDEYKKKRRQQLMLAAGLGVLACGLLYIRLIQRDTSRDVVEVRALSGFDSAGEPELRVQKNGNLQLVFKQFPPSDLDGKDAWLTQNFSKQLETASGAKVYWDNEIFTLDEPPPDCAEKVAQFVANYRKTYANELK